MTKYGVVVGSIRENSFSKGVADALVAGLPEDAEVNYLNISNLPLYNQDFDADSPEEYKSSARQLLSKMHLSLSHLSITEAFQQL